jgi:hypothetical protein
VKCSNKLYKRAINPVINPKPVYKAHTHTQIRDRVLLIITYLVGSAKRYCEDYFLWGRAGGSGDEIMELRDRLPENVW